MLALGGAILGSCSSEEPVITPPNPEPVEELAVRLNASEANAAKSLCKFENDFIANSLELNKGNIVVSPLGASMYLSMLANSSDSETAAKIVDALGCSDIEACNNLASKYLEWFPAADPDVKVSFENGLWYRKDKKLNPTFETTAKNFYDMDFFADDFNDDNQLRNQIAEWVDKNTNGMIKDLSMLSFKNEPAVLANIIAFRGAWTDPFDAEETTIESFYGKEKECKVEMMHREDLMAIGKTDKCLVLALPFGGERFHLICALPNEGVDLSELYDTFDEINKLRVTSTRVILSLPKFQILPDRPMIINDILSKMGISNLNFNAIYNENISDKIELNQLTAFEVNEKGAEAASAMLNGWSAAPETTIRTEEMNFNRPFLFLVSEWSTQLILFAGRVEQL